MRESWIIWVGPKSNDKRLEKKRRRQTKRSRRCEDGSRDWSDASASQGTPRIASSYQKLGEKHGAVSPTEPPNSI